jgi:hypothetical protein
MNAIVTGIFRATDNGLVADLLAKKALIEAVEKNPLGPVGLSCGGSSCSADEALCGLGIIDCGVPGIPCPCQRNNSTCGGNLVTGLKGLSGLNGTVDDLLGSVTSSMGDWKTWALVGGGILALVMLTGGGGSQRRAELAAAKAQYRSKVATIRASRPRRYQKYV